MQSFLAEISFKTTNAAVWEAIRSSSQTVTTRLVIDAVIRVYNSAGNVIETHEHTGDFKDLLVELSLFARRL